ncbi:MAG: indolepyruvate oxidoreductase subunit beta [Thermoprotei archaeon]
MKYYHVMIAGVGGQGNLLLSRIIGDAALSKGLRVRLGETFGAAQRGGSVHSHVRIGKEVYGPLMLEDEADALLALEPLEGLRRGVQYLREGGLVILNTRKVSPVDVNVGVAEYPSIDSIIESFKKLRAKIIYHDFTKIAEGVGSPRLMNVVILGVFAGAAENELPFTTEDLKTAINARVPPRWVDLNLRAFDKGYEFSKSYSIQ